MRRFRVSEIALGFLLATAFWIVVLWFITDPQTYHQICETNQYSGKISCTPHNVFYVVSWYLGYWFNASAAIITAIATAFIAWFTLTLKGSTDKLWDAGERRLKAMRENAGRQASDTQASIALAERSAKAAEDAAKAADLSAKAAIGVKLPSVHVAKIELYQPGPPHGQRGQSYFYRIRDGRIPNNAQVAIAFANIGESNAHITGICFEYFVGGRLPALPTYQRTIPFTETVIKAESEFEFRPMNFFISLTPEQDQAPDLLLVNHLWFYGYISYLDFMNMPHEHRFCQRWLTTSILGGPTGFVPEFYIPRDYTRSH